METVRSLLIKSTSLRLQNDILITMGEDMLIHILNSVDVTEIGTSMCTKIELFFYLWEEQMCYVRANCFWMHHTTCII